MANNKMSSLSKKNFAKFKQVVGYSEPYPCICDGDFVGYVQKKTGKPVSQALEELLGGKVQLIFSTRCVKDFVMDYIGHQLVVCSTNREDYAFYSAMPGRILVIPDGDWIEIAPLPRFLLRQPQPHFQMMEEYKRVISLRAPLETICEPEFIEYVQQNSLVLTSTLESLLGGRISLVSTKCIFSQMDDWKLDTSEFTGPFQICGHGGEVIAGAACLNVFKSMHPDSARVICTMKKREQYAKVPDKIFVIPDGRGGISIDNTLSQLSQSLFEVYKKVVGYSEPFPCICDTDFVEYVTKKAKKPVIQVLEQFLGGRVEMHSTMCIDVMTYGRFGERNKHPAIIHTCEHTRDLPEYDTHKCMKTFVRDYPSRLLVVCCYHKPDYDYYKLAPAIVLITPDSLMSGGIKIASVAKFPFGRPPPEIAIMDAYTRLFAFRPPYPTICEPGFREYVQERGSSLTDSMEALLGGEVKLLSTWCEYSSKIGCGHIDCIKNFVHQYPSPALVVCTLNNRDHYAKDVGRIVVTPNRMRTGIMIDTDPLPSIIQQLEPLKPKGDTENPGSEATGSKKIEIGGKSERAICFQGDTENPGSEATGSKKIEICGKSERAICFQG